MIHGKLQKQVDLEKLADTDFVLKGQFRVLDENYHEWNLKPEFKVDGSDTYVPFDQLFPEDKFNECYELILQTSDSSKVIGSGYLHKSPRKGVSFGVRRGFEKQEKSYINSFPIWFDLLSENDEPIINESADLIFVKVSPWHHERDNQRQRILKD